MIIDDAHQAAFVHIPKCGGASAVTQLGQFDSCGGAFRRIGEHPALGPIHYAHIPLRYLQQCFPDEFTKIATYQSFALVRDPQDRFASAVFQRIHENTGVSKLDITADAAIFEAYNVIKWLESRTNFCDLEYIHFARQIDYITIDQDSIVKHVFPLTHLAEFAKSLMTHCNIRFDPTQHENVNFASNNRILAMLRTAKPIYSRLTGWSLRKRILLRLKALGMQGPDRLYAELSDRSEISTFVKDYYAADFVAYRSATARLIDAA
jgi:hypothetical protein